MWPCIEPSIPASRRALLCASALLSFITLAPYCRAQSSSGPEQSPAPIYKTFYLGSSLSGPQDANEIQSDLRNMLPAAKIYYVPSQRALSMLGTPQDIALAEKILADLQHVRKAYRLVYSFSPSGSGSSAGQQKIALVVLDGTRADVKHGSKVPIVVGSFKDSAADVQYQDVGLEIEATLDTSNDGIRLRNKMAESSVADERSGVGTQDPLFRQTTLESEVTLVPGKPLVLGMLQVPGSNLQQQVEVLAEPIP